MNGCEHMKCTDWDGKICNYPEDYCKYNPPEETPTSGVPVKRLVIWRWLLFVPAGIFEICLALIAGIATTLHYVASVTLDIAYKLPSIDWYCGGEYVRRNAPDGKWRK